MGMMMSYCFPTPKMVFGYGIMSEQDKRNEITLLADELKKKYRALKSEIRSRSIENDGMLLLFAKEKKYAVMQGVYSKIEYVATKLREIRGILRPFRHGLYSDIEDFYRAEKAVLELMKIVEVLNAIPSSEWEKESGTWFKLYYETFDDQTKDTIDVNIGLKKYMCSAD